MYLIVNEKSGASIRNKKNYFSQHLVLANIVIFKFRIYRCLNSVVNIDRNCYVIYTVKNFYLMMEKI